MLERPPRSRRMIQRVQLIKHLRDPFTRAHSYPPNLLAPCLLPLSSSVFLCDFSSWSPSSLRALRVSAMIRTTLEPHRITVGRSFRKGGSRCLPSPPQDSLASQQRLRALSASAVNPLFPRCALRPPNPPQNLTGAFQFRKTCPARTKNWTERTHRPPSSHAPPLRQSAPPPPAPLLAPIPPDQ